ncbi:unnamed protein product [Didymodactylos carnosus]|uniref:G-protein coupled receptors family 1 profile domain-containing protein n=1 Tax=Didymodactylos carnosus TaxID=1234261 RepID=A0A8S2ELB9_9BILA|nr:unnamed protein product [Didymodactylos carnosus]CAF4063281.1 unnamed protein product [Didymodactylos carnosus]
MDQNRLVAAFTTSLSVAVGVFTLVCISIERYIAICRPLLILKLQSLPLGSLMNGLILAAIWFIGALTAIPNIYLHELKLLKSGTHKCEKAPVKEFKDTTYMMAVFVLYFLIPMIVMLVLYTLIGCKMYKNSTAMKMRSFQSSYQSKNRSSSSSPPQPSPLFCSNFNGDVCPSNTQTYSYENLPFTNNAKSGVVYYNSNHNFRRLSSRMSSHSNNSRSDDETYYNNNNNINSNNNPSLTSSSRSRIGGSNDSKPSQTTLQQKRQQRFQRTRTTSNPIFQLHSKDSNSSQHNHHHSKHSPSRFHRFLNTFRRSSSSTHAYRLDKNRRKALKILIVIILEFFICWTPLFIYHTAGTFNKNIYKQVPNVIVNLILLFSFASATCNPFTYYFMSKRYRLALYEYITCKICFTNVKKKNSQQLMLALQQHNQFLNNIYQHQQKRLLQNGYESNHNNNNNNNINNNNINTNSTNTTTTTTTTNNNNNNNNNNNRRKLILLKELNNRFRSNTLD